MVVESDAEGSSSDEGVVEVPLAKKKKTVSSMNRPLNKMEITRMKRLNAIAMEQQPTTIKLNQLEEGTKVHVHSSKVDTKGKFGHQRVMIVCGVTPGDRNKIYANTAITEILDSFDKEGMDVTPRDRLYVEIVGKKEKMVGMALNVVVECKVRADVAENFVFDCCK